MSASGTATRSSNEESKAIMRVLITGGAGFLGSHLCDRLIGMGHEVVCIDNLVTGSMDNVAHLLGHERFTYVHYNVCDYLYVEGPLDAVMHFASPASPQIGRASCRERG